MFAYLQIIYTLFFFQLILLLWESVSFVLNRRFRAEAYSLDNLTVLNKSCVQRQVGQFKKIDCSYSRMFLSMIAGSIGFVILVHFTITFRVISYSPIAAFYLYSPILVGILINLKLRKKIN